MYYIQDADYEEALKNGISRNLVWKRVYELNWSIERAITTPVGIKKRAASELLKKAEENGVNKSLYYRRIKKGMEPNEAATQPPGKKATRSYIFNEEELKIMESNGISLNTARHRLRTYLWTRKRAITEPVHINKRKKTSSK